MGLRWIALDCGSRPPARARTSLETAIECGELLTRQKAALKHGEWLPWCAGNLRFHQDTASNYMRLYRDKAIIGNVPNLGLSEAYRLLSQPAVIEEEEFEFSVVVPVEEQWEQSPPT